MTIQSKILALFPGFQLLCILCGSVLFVCSPAIKTFLLIPLAIYLLPLISFRIHQHYYPLKSGFCRMDTNDYPPWWGQYQIQLILNTFPAFERLLRVIPGVYSFWLRLWGSYIGSDVCWTPHIEVTDRDLLCIGNNVVIGHKVEFYAHVIRPKDGKLLLYTKKITIHDNCFIGAGSGFCPGTVVPRNVTLPIETRSERINYVFKTSSN